MKKKKNSHAKVCRIVDQTRGSILNRYGLKIVRKNGKRIAYSREERLPVQKGEKKNAISGRYRERPAKIGGDTEPSQPESSKKALPGSPLEKAWGGPSKG